MNNEIVAEFQFTDSELHIIQEALFTTTLNNINYGLEGEEYQHTKAELDALQMKMCIYKDLTNE